MIYKLFRKKIHFMLLCTLAALCCFSGCTQHNYKAEADEQVYNIIDQKWSDDFGSKANYKISDTNALPDDIKIEKVISPSGTLTLKDAVAIATAHNHIYQLEKELLYTTALDLRLARHDFEPWFFGSGGGGYASSDGDDGVGAAAAVGFNRLLATGARISTNIAVAWVRILTGDIQTGSLGTILTAEIIQPLLRGSDPKIVQENLTQAERNALYQIRTFNRFRKTFVVSIISQYYRVLELADTVKHAKENRHTLDWLYERVGKLANAGRVPREELEQVRQDTLRAWDTCIQAEKDYKQAIDEFKITLGLPTATEFQLDENELKALTATEMTCPDFSESDALEIALLQRLDIVNSADAIIDARRKIVVAADSLSGDLNLTVAAEIPSRGLSTSEIKELPDILTTNLELNLPLDRVAEQNEYRKALITLSQRQREYEQNHDIVTLEVRQAYRDLMTAMQRHKVQSSALELARKRLKNTHLLLQYGRASSRRVLDAQSDLFEAQNEAVDAMTDYTIATLNFYRDTGTLQVRPDGMWQM